MDDIAATQQPVPARRGITVAIYDENSNVRERMLHPGPYNIAGCLRKHCWDSCTSRCTVRSHVGTHDVERVVFVSPAQIRLGMLENCEGGFVPPNTDTNTDNSSNSSSNDISKKTARPFDVVVFPGGSARRQAERLRPVGLAAVRRFVAGGGGYVRSWRVAVVVAVVAVAAPAAPAPAPVVW